MTAKTPKTAVVKEISVSVTSAGEERIGDSGGSRAAGNTIDISDDGQVIVFPSYARLVDNDTNRCAGSVSEGACQDIYVHVRATAVFGIGLLLVGWQLMRARSEAPGVVRLALVLLGVLLAQMLVGEIQYRNALPWGLVLVHVTLAATIWAVTVGLVYTLWRPPLALVAPALERAAPLGEPLRTR